MTHPHRPDRARWTRRLPLTLLALALLAATLLPAGWNGLVALASPRPAEPSPLSSYALAQQAPFNRPGHYPIGIRPDPALYRPHADWIGRLSLPSVAQVEAAAASGERDWVWIEVEQAPEAQRQLVGQMLRLSWQDRPALRALVQTVSTDVQFGPSSARAEQEGNVLPSRLDGRRRVGPLQSLAGARPNDDVIVALEEVSTTPLADGGTGLQIGRPPVQITGRYAALVRILGPVATASDRYRVRHWNPALGSFNGPIDTVRIPQQPRDRFGRWISTPRGFDSHPLGAQGWYLYGAPDAEGLFTVQAIRPRALHRLQPDRVLPAPTQGLAYILHDNWRDTPSRRGRIERVLLARGDSDRPDGPDWQVGERGLLIHSFGGIGGPGGEKISGATVTGHFAFGEARVVRDAFTGEPRFDLRYHQIYANNPNGIVSGTQDWTAFTGDLQRGWMGSRPISDVVIHQDPFSELRLDDQRLSLLGELTIQAEVLMARYRSGDGTGVSTVTPSTSCVQDSSQALFIALQRIRAAVQGDSALRNWLSRHPDEPQARSFHQQVRLARSLDELLQPFGTVRSDWQRNALVVATAAGPPAGPAGDKDLFVRGETLRDALLSWRSMLPRRAHDDFARVFLQHGGSLWFLRTNQLAGGDTTIEPLAPTLLLGQIPALSTLLRRVTDALFTPLSRSGAALTLAVLLGYGALALVIGQRSGFLCRHCSVPGGVAIVPAALGLLLMPALGEELLFRVALLPHPLEGVTPLSGLAWGALSVGLFVLYHPLAASSWYPAGRGVFHDPRFLLQCALLAVACVLAYDLTGSLWAPVLIHWLAVTLWLWALGGRARMGDSPPSAP